MHVSIFQIFYDDESRLMLHPAFIPLDNTNGPSDWFEFHPMMEVLERLDLAEERWYGFLSPRFFEKTGLTYDGLICLLEYHDNAEVGLFSSHWPQLALYRNVWEHGEEKHPGLMNAFRRFLEATERPTLPQLIVSDFQTSVFSNFIIAKRRFWLDWLDLAQDYRQYAEAQERSATLPEWTDYKGHRVPMKVFVQERLCNYLLLTKRYRSFHPDYRAMIGCLDSRVREKLSVGDQYKLAELLYQCDMAKKRYRRFLLPHHLLLYQMLRRRAYKMMNS